MRKILLINLMAIIANSLTAQKVGSYYTKNLDAYVGTWEYVSDSCTFRIYLKKGISYYNMMTKDIRGEKVYGGHYIERNGVVITDLEAATQAATEDNSSMTISATNWKEVETMVTPNVLTLAFSDVLKDKGGSGKLTLIPGNPAQLRWQITETDERIIIWVEGVDPEPVEYEGWTVPEDVILTQISNSWPVNPGEPGGPPPPPPPDFDPLL